MRTTPLSSLRPGTPGPGDFAQAPFIAIWEVTRACALACVHCRADAIPRRHPHELTTGEAFRLIDQVRAFGDPPPLFVLTGGDPMRRPDLLDLVSYASDAGLNVALTPSGTAAVTRKRLAELQAAGLKRVAVSLDGADAATHDAFRRVRGSYDCTMRIVDAVIDLGMPLQINTTIGRITYPHLEGRRPKHRITTGSPPSALDSRRPSLRPWRRCSVIRARAAAWTDGNGFVFIDHVGHICPSGFLPMVCGSVRMDSVVGVYRDHPLFVQLRDIDRFEGKCGRCAFRHLCGGSRARAYSATGSPFASDPLCAYEPEEGNL